MNKDYVNKDHVAESLGLASVHWLPGVSSTQDYARALKDRTPYLVVSDRQTGGRGRMGRSWVSEPGGLYFTLGLNRFPADWAMPLVSAHLIRLNLASLIPELTLKWPNDIWHLKGKLAGVMVEGWSGNRLGVGVGVNVNQSKFPGCMTTPAVSLAMVSGKTFDIREVLTALTAQVIEGAGMLKLHGFSYFHPAIKRTLLAGNQMVKFRQSGALVTGRLSDLTEEGEGVVQTGNGTSHCLSLMHMMGEA